jgi:hypothetical protein
MSTGHPVHRQFIANETNSGLVRYEWLGRGVTTMQQTSFRAAAAIALVIPALATNDVAAQDNRNKGGPAVVPHAAPAAPAPHVAPAAPPPQPHVAAPPTPAPHVAAPAPHVPAPAPHVAAPTPHVAAPAPHIAAPAPHVAAPAPQRAPHVAAPAPHIAAPTPHVAAPAHAPTHVAAPARVATPHPPAAQIARQNAAPGITRQQQREEKRLGRTVTPPNVQQPNIQQAHGNAPNANVPNAVGAKNRGSTPNPAVAAPNATTPTGTARGQAAPPTPAPALAGQPPSNRGRNPATQQSPAQAQVPAQVQAQAQAKAQARAQVFVPGQKPVLRNPVLASLSPRDPATRALASATFRGQFAQQRGQFGGFADRFASRALVIGWIGPVFWPYAYADVVDYTLWPYATDTFWPYAYDDLYSGIYGNYAPDLMAYGGNLPSTYGYGGQSNSYGGRYGGEYGGRQGYSYDGRQGYSYNGRQARTTGLPPVGSAEICTGQESGIVDWPVERIAQQVQPDSNQQSLLDKLKNATARAVAVLQSACPTDLPSTPTGRLAAVRQRIEAMLEAVRIIGPALDSFYQSLSDEQKERFNALDSGNAAVATARRGRSAGRQPDLAQVCSSQATQVSSIPSARIDQALRLDQTQHNALENLKDASARAADFLSRNCPQDASLTPPGRVAAMEQRLGAMLQALDTVQPALARFYNSLSDEQKARFDRLPRQA